MTEVNERWERDNLLVKKLTVLGIILAPMLWYVSYSLAWPAALSAGPWQWFTAVSVATLMGALASTIGTIIGMGIILTDTPPLEGSNR